MPNAVRTVAMAFGAFAGFGGLEHGLFEVLRGSEAPPTLVFPAMAPPCDPDVAWHGCEPAMSIIPNLELTGLLAMAIGAAAMIWASGFEKQRYWGAGIAAFSLVLLLVGGGLIPPVMGMLGGLLAIRTLRETPVQRSGWRAAAAAFWPWSLFALGLLLAGMVLAGYLNNNWVKDAGAVVLAGVPLLTMLSLVSAWARDG